MQDRKRETADALQNVGGDSSRKRRAITHTFIIIALSGTVCKGKKSSAKRGQALRLGYTRSNDLCSLIFFAKK